MDRRTFLQGAAAGAAALAFSQHSLAEQTDSNPDLTAIQKEIEKRHDESVQRLQQWIRQPSIAAEKRGMGKCVVGRGAVNQKGPEASFLAALHAIRGTGRKLPVNLVLVAEGEEEIGSP